VFKNRVLRRIFEHKRDKVTEGRRKLKSSIICTLHQIRITRMVKSRRMRWAGHVENIGELRNEYEILVAKLERKRPLGRRQDNMKMGTRKIGWELIGFIWLKIWTGGWLL
jgi:hypothetical protein